MERETDFAVGREQWLDRLGNLRNVVRQEVIARQLARHVPDFSRMRVMPGTDVPLPPPMRSLTSVPVKAPRRSGWPDSGTG